jgi:hypothetical protein
LGPTCQIMLKNALGPCLAAAAKGWS